MKKNTITIIFSRNRALQLNLCLTTLFKRCKDIQQLSNIYVLHRNDPQHEESYKILQSEFPKVNFVPEKDFKNDLLGLVHKSDISCGSTPPYMLVFMVDDTIYTSDFSMKEIISTLVENNDCLGFSLRLGYNCSECFPYNCSQNIPETKEVSKNIVKYNWQNAEYDFGYPLELSSSVYKTKDIIEILEDCSYDSPNFLETRMAESYIEDKPNLLMYKSSVAFSLPVNKVQSSHNNRSGNLDAEKMLEMFMAGYRINDDQFYGFISKGAHDLVENIRMDVKNEH